jgi:hypothetical protein
MSPSDLVDSMLTVLFAVAAAYGLYRSVTSRGAGWRACGDQLLHTAMALTMAVMPWSPVSLVHQPAQATFFAAAAVWFPLTAVPRPDERRVTAVARRLPSTVGMAAMAWMAWAAHPVAGPQYEYLARPLNAAHHIDMPGHSAHPSTVAQATTAALALCLAAYALWSLLRIMPPLHALTDLPPNPTDRHDPYTRFWDGSVALGTTLMLLMPH